VTAPARLLADGLGFTEGPVCVGHGRTVFVDGTGLLRSFDGAGVHEVARTGGSPNGIARGSDGAFYVAQAGLEVEGGVARPPDIQRAWPTGAVEQLGVAGTGYVPGAPNDLAFGPDGRLYFTDPGGPYDRAANRAPGKVCALSGEGCETLLDLGDVYVNGIAFDEKHRLLWSESYTRRLMRLEQGTRTIVHEFPEGHVPDGFALAEDGRVFVATLTSCGISVIAPDGRLLEHLGIDGWPTNCAFDGHVLYVTAVSGLEDHGTGMLWAIDTDARGSALHAGRLDSF
jgi:gluconolactonase